MNFGYLSRMYKKTKLFREEEEYGIVLNLTIYRADGLENPITNPWCNLWVYQAIGWVIPGQEVWTQEAIAEPHPIWDLKLRIPLGNPKQCPDHLNLEVVRAWPRLDPGTSRGIASVGKTQILLPTELSTRKEGRFGLMKVVGSGHKPGGHISVGMELKKMENMFNKN